MTNLGLSGLYKFDQLLHLYSQLLLIRKVELSIGRESKKNSFRTPIHLAIGQEAIAVGISAYLSPKDRIFGNHRSHAHYLALGGSVQKLILEILGKRGGCSGGKGGSMHISSTDTGFIGSMPIVAGTIPIAVGASLEFDNESKNISVCYFGDGASEEGVFHEALNFAAKFNAPTLFVCENNLFSSHMHIDQRQNSRSISRFANSAGILNFEVDGNSLLDVMNCADEAINHVRMNRKPAFIEALTYRIYSHVGFDTDLNVGLNRISDLKEWSDKDPISLLRKTISENFPNEIDWDVIENKINGFVEDSWIYGLNAEFPDSSELLKNVYWSKE